MSKLRSEQDVDEFVDLCKLLIWTRLYAVEKIASLR
jgi:hypothetical protein